ncbi:MAG: hypothetical protein ACRENE_07195 [Polyangiaceae bacterium]
MSWYEFRPYVSASEKRRRAAREVAKRKKKGLAVEPVTIAGRAIASTFWGKGWCDHLESYSDYANRLPRGRTYVRNGSVLHLGVGPGRIDALVQGSELYEVSVDVTPLAKPRWKGVVSACAGQIDSLVELLQGKLSRGVMRVVSDRERGLFPAPSQIQMKCSCPDWAEMCKHVAAVLYGIGARLDERPDLLFTLRKVDHLELLSAGAKTSGARRPSDARSIDASDLGSVFGIDIDVRDAGVAPRSKRRPPLPAPPAVHPSRNGGRHGRRSAGTVGEMVDRIVELLEGNKTGLRAEQIRAALGVQASDLPRAIAAALASGRVRKRGQKRATTYLAM